MARLDPGTRVAIAAPIMFACILAAVPSVLALALFVATLRLHGSRASK